MCRKLFSQVSGIKASLTMYMFVYFAKNVVNKGYRASKYNFNIAVDDVVGVFRPMSMPHC